MIRSRNARKLHKNSILIIAAVFHLSIKVVHARGASLGSYKSYSIDSAASLYPAK